MAPKIVASFLLTTLCLHTVFLPCHLSLAASNHQQHQQVPCYFIFGDSLADNGNNNQLPSLARANYPPYGIDFPTGPSGRFSNGKTIVDVVGELLGFDGYIPPYQAVNGEKNYNILKGVNYASGAAGIRDETGGHLGVRVSFSGQVSNYQDTVSRIVDLLDGDDVAAAKHLSKCIYSIGLGSNDYLNNYFLPLLYPTGFQFTPEEYADDLIRIYTSQLQIFNDKLLLLVDRLNSNTSDAKFIFINAYGIFMELINNPTAHGFEETKEACCGVGMNNGEITCLPFQNPCDNRTRYLFWDAFHPTEAANMIMGRRSYDAESASDSYPFDIRRLARL